MEQLFVRAVALLALLIASTAYAHDSTLQITAHEESSTVDMGRSVTLDVSVRDQAGAPVPHCLVLSYVNGKRWGAQEVSGGDGTARIILPLPNPGPCRIVVRAVPGFYSPCWIWVPRSASPTAFVATTFPATSAPKTVSLRAAATGHCRVFVNGTLAGEASGVDKETVIDMPAHLVRPGANFLAIEAENSTGMAAVAAQLRFQTESGERVISTGRNWMSWEEAPAGWPSSVPDAGAPVRSAARLWDGLFPVDPFVSWFGGVRRDELFAGRMLPADALVSEPVSVNVTRRTIASSRDPNRLIGMQWGSYFFPGGFYWQTAQAVPLTGFYDAYNRDVIRQQALWFMDMGIDFLMADWPVYIPPDKKGEQHWRDRTVFGIEQIHVTTMMLEGLAALRDEGLHPPAMVIMAYLVNGPPNTTATLNEELEWLYQNFIRNPRFHDLWVMYHGKPLVTVLYTPKEPADSLLGPPVDDSHFTIRYVGTQLQATHVDQFGYWSWMDGVADPVVTRVNGKPEAVTPAAGFFTLDTGWLGKQAHGRRNGATLLRTFVPALKERPKFVLFHQWNEFTGQAEGYPYENGIYGDTYSVELSDDIEPVSLTSAGYRGDHGGWGFRYVNLTKALVDLYKQSPTTDTLMALYSPARGQQVTVDSVRVAWETIGKPPTSFAILLDGVQVADGLKSKEFTLDLTGAASGTHVVSVVAAGAETHYRLNRERMDSRLSEAIPVRAEIPFSVARGAGRKGQAAR